ncbi:MAG: hypothetical protein HQM10_02800 [Candidatus Riflebacteria bacterium]|nr:hypothetical protein [Candidatus Riflebacteria bacterium]
MNRYRIHGMNVLTNYVFPFPQTEFSDSDIGLTIIYKGKIKNLQSFQKRNERRVWHKSNNSYYLQYCRTDSPDFLSFEYSEGGKTITVSRNNDYSSDISLIILNPAISAALYLQGITCLHASGVVINGKAVLFTGESGAGKSSLTSNLAALGHQFLCDDLAAIDFANDGVFVKPAFPMLKASSAAIRAAGIPDSAVFRAAQWAEDEYWIPDSALKAGFCKTQVPLEAIYHIKGRKENITQPEFVELSPSNGAFLISKQLYGKTWLKHCNSESFKPCSRIASNVKITEIWTPEDAERIKATSEQINTFHGYISKSPSSDNLSQRKTELYLAE